MTATKPRLYLHLGTHRNGTTALQSFSVANRDALWQQGCWYPDFAPVVQGPKDGYHTQAHAFSAQLLADITRQFRTKGSIGCPNNSI